MSIGYLFPEIDNRSAAVLNPSETLKSPDELEQEDRAAQAAKLQELIRRGLPSDLEEANVLMKIMAGYDPEAKPDYKKQANEELDKIQQKTILLNDMLDNVKSGEKIGANDIFEELSQACKAVQPKIQKFVSEDDDTESIESWLIDLEEPDKSRGQIQITDDLLGLSDSNNKESSGKAVLAVYTSDPTGRLISRRGIIN
ncbi:4297_t:CDS:2, partial [Funneliformis mosseae]